METLDQKLLLQNVDGDPELLREIVDLFFESRDEIVADLRGAVSSADAGGISRTAHQLRGALANVGAKAAADVAQRLEALGERGETGNANDVMSELETELTKLTPELHGLVDSVD